jgi:hypothetical protein
MNGSDIGAVVAAIRDNSALFSAASEDAADTEAIARVAVSTHPQNLKHCSPRLRNDRELVLLACRIDGSALMHASEALREDMNVVLTAVENVRMTSFFCVYDINNMDDTSSSPSVFYYFLISIGKKNKHQNGAALLYASPKLRGAPEFMLAAIERTPLALEYAPDDLLKSKQFMLQALAVDGELLRCCPVWMKSDPAVVTAAVRSSGRALHHATFSARSDRAVVLAALAQNSGAGLFMSDTLRSDKAFFLEVVKMNGEALVWAANDVLVSWYCCSVGPPCRRHSSIICYDFE